MREFNGRQDWYKYKNRRNIIADIESNINKIDPESQDELQI